MKAAIILDILAAAIFSLDYIIGDGQLPTYIVIIWIFISLMSHIALNDMFKLLNLIEAGLLEYKRQINSIQNFLDSLEQDEHEKNA